MCQPLPAAPPPALHLPLLPPSPPLLLLLYFLAPSPSALAPHTVLILSFHARPPPRAQLNVNAQQEQLSMCIFFGAS